MTVEVRKLVPEFGPLRDALAELTELIKRVESPVGLGDLMVDIKQAIAEPGQLELVPPAAKGAPELVMRAEPSDRLLRVLATMRARYGVGSVIEKSGHEISPEVVCLESSASGESGEGVNHALSRSNDEEGGQ